MLPFPCSREGEDFLLATGPNKRDGTLDRSIDWIAVRRGLRSRHGGQPTAVKSRQSIGRGFS